MRTTVLETTLWPAALAGTADERSARLQDRCPALCRALEEAGFGVSLRQVLGVSEFALRVLLQRPELIEEALAAGRLAAPDAPVLPASDVSDQPLDECGTTLRRVRDRELFLIAWHDLLGSRATTDTLEALSTLADALICTACDAALARANEQRDSPLPPPVILAMGKLGGGELNFSSDVDLVFLHEDGPEEFSVAYTRLARTVINVLDQRTAQGFVYRVDVRLRPFGTTGALSLSLGAFESYLQAHARDWERYAYVKTRALTGRAEVRAQLAHVLGAYVYRRYLDFGLFEALRNTRGLIEQDLRRNDGRDNIKRGAGGIRDIEFVVQALQLLRGGRQRQLQTTSLLDALAQLQELGWIDSAAAESLRAAYLFLRHVENRLQEFNDAQTHVIAQDDASRSQLAVSLGVPSWSDVADALHNHRAVVQAVFVELLGDEMPQTDEADPMVGLWAQAGEREQVLAWLESEGVAQAAQVAEQIYGLHASRPLARLGRIARERLGVLMPRLLRDVLKTDAPGVALARIARVIEGVGRRSAYFALLNENPDARERLVALCAASARIARDVAETPLLLDSLLDPKIVELPTRAARSQQLRAALHGVPHGDLELIIDALSHFKSAALFEVAVADLSSQLDVMKVSDQLTWIAQSIVGEVLVTARRDTATRYGQPPGDHNNFCVVAYGKLGGLELGYGSDLDLVFLYGGPDEDVPSDGPRALPKSMYFARLVQRFVHIASAVTRTGSLYDIDMRLRPSGNSGPLASRLSAFENYQLNSAWTWEHQSLLRARVVAGDDELAARFDAVRRAVLCQQREQSTLADDVRAMRARMRKAHKPVAGRFHIKGDAGGLTDVEFLVQYHLLLHAHLAPTLVEFSDHMRQLDALIETGVLAPGVGEALQAAYLAYRGRLHRLALDESDGTVVDGQLAQHRTRVGELWTAVFG